MATFNDNTGQPTFFFRSLEMSDNPCSTVCPFLARKRLKNSIFSHFTPQNSIMTSSVMTSSKWRFFQKNSWWFFDNSQDLLWHICPFLARKWLKNSIFSDFTPLNTIMTLSVMTSSKWIFFRKNRWSFFDNSPDLLWHIYVRI